MVVVLRFESVKASKGILSYENFSSGQFAIRNAELCNHF